MFLLRYWRKTGNTRAKDTAEHTLDKMSEDERKVYDLAAQTRQVMANLVTALQAAGVGIEHLVSVLVMLVEGVDVQAAYAAAAATLGSAKAPPLVSAAIVSGLGVPGAMVEVSAIAAMPDRAPTD